MGSERVCVVSDEGLGEIKWKSLLELKNAFSLSLVERMIPSARMSCCKDDGLLVLYAVRREEILLWYICGVSRLLESEAWQISIPARSGITSALEETLISVSDTVR